MRKSIGLIFIILSIGFTSCIELIEGITLNEDKSGSVFIGIESKVLASLLSLAEDQITPGTIDELEKLPIILKDRITEVKGISEVSAFDKINDGRLGIYFKFSDPKALNQAYFALADVTKKWYHPKVFRVSKNKISRRNLSPLLVQQLEKEYPEMIDSKLIKFISLNVVVQLQAPPTSVFNGKEKVPINTNKVSFEYGLAEILKEEKSTAFKIRF